MDSFDFEKMRHLAAFKVGQRLTNFVLFYQKSTFDGSEKLSIFATGNATENNQSVHENDSPDVHVFLPTIKKQLTFEILYFQF